MSLPSSRISHDSEHYSISYQHKHAAPNPATTHAMGRITQDGPLLRPTRSPVYRSVTSVYGEMRMTLPVSGPQGPGVAGQTLFTLTYSAPSDPIASLFGKLSPDTTVEIAPAGVSLRIEPEVGPGNGVPVKRLTK